MTSNRLCFFLCAVGGFGPACAPEEIEQVPAEGGVPSTVVEAFNDNCGVVGCHAGATPTGGLDLRDVTEDRLVGVPSSQGLPLVSLGTIDESYMGRKLLGHSAIKGDQMPKGGGGDPEQIALILGWIGGLDLPSPNLEPYDFTDASFERVVTEACSCHNLSAEDAPQGLSLIPSDAIENILGVEVPTSAPGWVYIDPGHPETSLIWHAVAHSVGVDPVPNKPKMPLGGRLNAEQLQAVQGWILCKAPAIVNGDVAEPKCDPIEAP